VLTERAFCGIILYGKHILKNYDPEKVRKILKDAETPNKKVKKINVTTCWGTQKKIVVTER